MEIDEQAPKFKSGFVALVGRPNVGKSTLMNAFMQQKIAIVTPRPQTTRTRQLGIITEPHYQMIFIDTPGLIKNPRHKLDTFMVETAVDAFNDADVILWLVDSTSLPGPSTRPSPSSVSASTPWASPSPTSPGRAPRSWSSCQVSTTRSVHWTSSARPPS